MLKFRVLPLVLGVSLVPQVASAADLISIAQDALTNNASLLGDQAGVNATKEGEGVARGALLPQVNANASVSRNHTSNTERTGGGGASQLLEQLGMSGAASSGSEDKTHNESSVTIQATQSLFNATNWYSLQAAKRQTAQQILNFSNNRQTLLFDVANAYFTVLRAKELLDTDRAAEAAYKRQLEQVQEQFDVGVVAATDLREAEASYDSARAARISQESTLTVDFDALTALTGKQYPSIDKLSEDMPIAPPKPANREAWVEMGNSQNLALKTARAGIDSARANVAIARAGHLPTLDAVASWSYGGTSRYRGFNKQNQIGLQASIPIYSGGATSAQVNQNTYQLEQAQFQAEEQLRRTVQNISSFFAQSNNNVLSVEAQKRAVVSNRASLKATQDGYEAGTRTILDVLNSQNSYYASLQAYSSARYDYVLNMLQLRQNAGILDVGTLQTLNGWLVKDNSPVRLDGKGDSLVPAIGDASIDVNKLGS
ncbi:TolC family outer membrane protein [Carnimonas bestiolae]|uniref:TolC family outer membrane protein n=1 Tax=Carnimonas bestiolae TaxID=3402172 RepID=UPI003EDCB019